MRKKIKTIMLVDDDRNDNYFHERTIRKINPEAIVIVRTTGIEAMDYLNSGETKPDLILLDINMPVWDGWAFLLEFSRLDMELREGIMIVVLTSSQNTNDKVRAKAWDFVSGFFLKPLTEEMLESIGFF